MGRRGGGGSVRSGATISTKGEVLSALTSLSSNQGQGFEGSDEDEYGGESNVHGDQKRRLLELKRYIKWRQIHMKSKGEGEGESRLGLGQGLEDFEEGEEEEAEEEEEGAVLDQGPGLEPGSAPRQGLADKGPGLGQEVQGNSSQEQEDEEYMSVPLSKLSQLQPPGSIIDANAASLILHNEPPSGHEPELVEGGSPHSREKEIFSSRTGGWSRSGSGSRSGAGGGGTVFTAVSTITNSRRGRRSSSHPHRSIQPPLLSPLLPLAGQGIRRKGDDNPHHPQEPPDHDNQPIPGGKGGKVSPQMGTNPLALSERSNDNMSETLDVEAYLFQEYPYGIAQGPGLGSAAQGPGLGPGVGAPIYTRVFDPNRVVSSDDRSTLLMFAANENNVELIRELVRRGANIEVDTPPNTTITHLADLLFNTRPFQHYSHLSSTLFLVP